MVLSLHQQFQSEACEEALTRLTVLMGRRAPGKRVQPAGQPPSSSPPLLCEPRSPCVPEEMAHISLLLVLLAVQLFAPIHLPPETTGRGNEEGEPSEREGSQGPGARGGAKGHQDLGVSVRAPEPGGSQSFDMLANVCPNSYVHQSNLAQSGVLTGWQAGGPSLATKTECHT